MEWNWNENVSRNSSLMMVRYGTDDPVIGFNMMSCLCEVMLLLIMFCLVVNGYM